MRPGLVVRLGLIVFALAAPAHAEVYLEGYGGLSMPNGLDNPTQIVGGKQVQYTTPSLEQFGYLIGAKVGYLPVFWHDVKIVGFELDIAYQEPTLKAQTLGTTTNGVKGGAPLSQTSLSVASGLANIYLQYPGDRLRPYLGAGVGIMHISGPLPFASVDRMSPAFDVFAGLRYQITDKISTVVEYKHMNTSIQLPAGGNKVQFASDNFLLGIAYHFNESTKQH